MKKKKASYTKKPSAESSVLSKLDVIVRVQSGLMTVSDGARALGLSRNHFQTVMHEALGAMIESLTPKKAGRPAKDQHLKELEDESGKLQKENDELKKQVALQENALQTLVDIVKQQSNIRPREQRSKKQKSTTESTNEAEDDRRRRLELAMRLNKMGLRIASCAAVAGVSTSTFWRGRHRARNRLKLLCKRGPRRATPSAELVAQATKLVEEMRGQIGAPALAKATGLSRRQSAAVKERVLIDLERKRKRAARRVRVAAPNIMRGMDAMYIPTAAGPVYALLCGDVATSYRTTSTVVPEYTEEHVAAVLADDVRRFGAPLVYRFDRHASHLTAKVRDLLEENSILLLNGPPHYPQYYGQRERQIREERDFISADISDIDEAASEIREARRCLNELKPRHNLGWWTSAEAQMRLPRVDVDREEFRSAVEDRRARLRKRLGERELHLQYDWRFAIEQELIARGLLTINNEGWC
jgi:predicted DNA-binding protein (UPF0251 family)